MQKRPSVLTIAGSDSGGGAGIQADLKTIAWFAVHGASAITAITAQNSREVTAVFALPDSIIEAQVDAVMRDLRPSVVKIGMLGTEKAVILVEKKLREWKPKHIVLDPVMIASSGAKLLEDDAIAALRSRLVPLATVVTPNWPEAEALIGRRIEGLEGVDQAAEAFSSMNARAVLLKGGHLAGEEVVDMLIEPGEVTRFRHPRLQQAEGHGTGCALASAVAAGLALGLELKEACRKATDFVHDVLARRYAVGNSKENYLGILPIR
ncbi:MAG TPA: bifunctional hydroxymethylpyrimidine kinase/phosphomethylpyrimidine kinase [Thermoanaerobaculia bacterium]|nr:bifunctional hydroxymethylpyrimidine kinase/phosphomethylpyrimidine kinase [Thermoanaerobaculia bacterium]